jgi:hypothetical protein
MGTVIGLVGGHEIAGGRLSVDLRMEIGKRRTQALVQHPHPVFIGCFLGVPANYGNRRVGH